MLQLPFIDDAMMPPCLLRARYTLRDVELLMPASALLMLLDVRRATLAMIYALFTLRHSVIAMLLRDGARR